MRHSPRARPSSITCAYACVQDHPRSLAHTQGSLAPIFWWSRTDRDRYTVVVKLTPDAAGEAPSRCASSDPRQHFHYGPAAGAAGCWARLYHSSVAPLSQEEHPSSSTSNLSTRGERRVKRALGKTVDATKLAQRCRLVAAELSEASVVSAPELP